MMLMKMAIDTLVDNQGSYYTGLNESSVYLEFKRKQQLEYPGEHGEWMRHMEARRRERHIQSRIREQEHNNWLLRMREESDARERQSEERRREHNDYMKAKKEDGEEFQRNCDNIFLWIPLKVLCVATIVIVIDKRYPNLLPTCLHNFIQA